MKHTRVARRYARALMMAAVERNILDRTAADILVLEKTLASSRELRLLLASPVVSVQKKSGILTEVFAKAISRETLAFLHFLVEKNRESLLPEVMEQFNALRDERLGIVTVDVRAAVELAPSQEKSLQSHLEVYTGMKVRVRFSLDKSIKGGLLVQIGDTVLDASIRRQLERLREQFISGGAVTN